MAYVGAVRVGKYDYKLSCINDALWIVRRWAIGADDDSYDECQVRSSIADANAIIQLAIEQGSWA